MLDKALLFDHTTFITGAVGIRDSACYICWSFSRAYEKTTLESGGLRELASTLVCMALFDREVNVRRAASAAFQVRMHYDYR